MIKFNSNSLRGILILAGISVANFCSAQLSGTYTIDTTKTASKTNYSNFSSAVSDLDSGIRSDGGTPNGKGVKGPVVFNVADGTYNDNIIFGYVKGSSSKNTVTFQGMHGDTSFIQFSLSGGFQFDSANYYTVKNLGNYMANETRENALLKGCQF